MPDVAPLDAENVVPYLRERGLLKPSSRTVCREYTGGVSGVTLLVDAGVQRLVVKQALSHLRVDRDWPSDPRRAVVEARALQTYAAITPDATPTLIDIDAERCAFIMSAAPEGTQTWKDQLLAGIVDLGVAGTVGSILGRWHAATRDPDAFSGFEDRTFFDELRVRPFYQAVMAARPSMAGAVADHLSRMLSERQVLVHGDFSPKNVLVKPDDGVWLVDFEVAHRGDPAFDVAFLLHHLLLKAIHLPAHSAALLDSARTALLAYQRVPGTEEIPHTHLMGHVGCLTLARVLGTSPANYLNAEERVRAEAIGSILVERPPADLRDIWPDERPAR